MDRDKKTPETLIKYPARKKSEKWYKWGDITTNSLIKKKIWKNVR